jgi:hypothetical protein
MGSSFMTCKFDYMNFYGGSDGTEFVAHANKYTKEQAINLCISENDWRFEQKNSGGDLLREPTVDDIVHRHVKWYVKAPDWCGYDDGGEGCYTYCAEGLRGSFPVWVIAFDKLNTDK